MHKLILLVVASSLLVEAQGMSHFCDEIKDETMTKLDICTKNFKVSKNNKIPANRWKIDLEALKTGNLLQKTLDSLWKPKDFEKEVAMRFINIKNPKCTFIK